MNAREALQNARQRLIDQGWSQGTWLVGMESNCALTAILTEGPTIPPAVSIGIRRLYEALAIIAPGCSLVGWNDALDRCVEDVLFLYDLAILLERDANIPGPQLQEQA